jgi:mRNA interferase MazF
MAIVCPITNTDKNHPFHVRLSQGLTVRGVILCDQPRTLDIFARNYEKIERLPNNLLFEVLDIIGGFIEPE